ncbi:MAG: HigA family addiction module antidote protein [Gammaproteobacteria bacterium]|nr:HigA family addiction module antidote protein [Gammaproteobacteria bacterium]
MVMHKPLHPGLIVKDALIDNTDLTITEAAIRIGVTRTTLSRLLNGKSGISPEMALRLSKFFGNSIEMWINLQAQYDVWQIRQHSDEIDVDRFDEAA